MIPVTGQLIHIGQLHLSNSLNQQTIKRLDKLTTQFHAQSSDEYIDSRWSFKFDRNGNVVFYTARPRLDLMREFAAEHYLLKFTVTAPSYQQTSVEITVTGPLWSETLSQAEELLATEADTPPALLFDVSMALQPQAVAAQVSLSSLSQNTIDPADYILQITSPSPVIGQALGSLPIWSFSPLPVASEVTLEVSLAADDSLVTSVELTIDYSQPLNIRDIAIDD